ncbi:MAG: hypothetical protein ABEI13_04640 [Candidatus Paceibacteria bacterium]
MSELQQALEHVSSHVFTAHLRKENIHLLSPYPDISTESNNLPVLTGETNDWIEVENLHGDKIRVAPDQQIVFQVDQGKTDRGTLYASEFEYVENLPA